MILPYPLKIDSGTGLYYFTTETNIVYYCGFRNQTNDLSPLIGVYDISITEFEFHQFIPDLKTKPSRRQDPRVAITITKLLLSFFSDKSKIIVFLCENMDGRALERQTLFSDWYRKFMKNSLIKISLIIEYKELVIYGGILVRNDFEYMQLLHTELADKAVEIISSKFDDN